LAKYGGHPSYVIMKHGVWQEFFEPLKLNVEAIMAMQIVLLHAWSLKTIADCSTGRGCCTDCSTGAVVLTFLLH